MRARRTLVSSRRRSVADLASKTIDGEKLIDQVHKYESTFYLIKIWIPKNTKYSLNSK